MREPKIAIITGGSRGLGKAMVKSLGKLKYDVVINYRSESSKASAQEAADLIEKGYNVNTLLVQADVSKYDECKKLVDEAVNWGEKLGCGKQISALINNAGITKGVSFLDIKVEEYEAVVNTNLMSFLHMCHLTLPYMVNHASAEKQCNIVSTASIGGLMGVANQTEYSAAKAGVIGMTRSLAMEFGGRHIRVNAIAPGMIKTDMLASVSQEEVAALAQAIPLGKIGDATDIAGCLEYILSAPYLTGQTISPNGGIVMP